MHIKCIAVGPCHVMPPGLCSIHRAMVNSTSLKRSVTAGHPLPESVSESRLFGTLDIITMNGRHLMLS